MLGAAIGRGYLAAQRSSRWARRRFTTLGFCLLIGLAVTLGTANAEQTMGLGTFLLLATALFSALVVAPFFRVRWVAERQAPHLATAGEPFTVPVVVRNLGGRSESGLEYGEDLREVRLAGADAAARLWSALRPGRGPGLALRAAACPPVPVPRLAPAGSAELTVTITAWRRGPLILAGSVFMRTDALGLFRAFARVRTRAAQTVLILPQRHPLPELDLPGRAREWEAGTALAGGSGASEEFAALRDYRRGDPRKRVHWRSAARTGRLVVKEYRDEQRMRHGLILDTSCTEADAVRFEEAVAVAASFACTVPNQESLLDLLVVGPIAVQLAAGRGLGAALPLLEVLATVRPSRATDPGELVAGILPHRASLSSCVLILLAWDGPRRAVVKRLRALRLPLTVLLILPPGAAAPEVAADPGERPDRLVVLTSGRIAAGLRALGPGA
jgi:uncharacterized protein (DUF58 family)